MSSEDNYLLSSRGSSLGIFRKQMDLTTLIDRLKVNIFLLITEVGTSKNFNCERFNLVITMAPQKVFANTNSVMQLGAYNQGLKNRIYRLIYRILEATDSYQNERGD